MNKIILAACIISLFINCKGNNRENRGLMESAKAPYTIMTLDPGHFHAALVQKRTYPKIDSVVYVYAPEGNDLKYHMGRIEGFNTRAEDPTNWNEQVYAGKDFFEKFLSETPGNIVVIAGNNAKKSQYITGSIEAGIHVLADKPMVITSDDFPALQKAFQLAERNGVMLYDIMTERYEISTILQKALSQVPEIFGELSKGSPDMPAITKESVHHFFKYVSGKPLIRPAWFFDTSQQGEGIIDVTTHLVDLVQWACFPDQIIEYENKVEIIDANRWTTELTVDQFRNVTEETAIPDYLKKNVVGDVLKVYSNGNIVFKINDVYAKVSVTWNFQAPEGGGDTHYSTMRGSLSELIIKQGEAENYKPFLYIKTKSSSDDYTMILEDKFRQFVSLYPGLELEEIEPQLFRVNIPDIYRLGHESHFSQVVDKYLEYLETGSLPDWEVPNMLSKYYITTEAYKLAHKKK